MIKIMDCVSSFQLFYKVQVALTSNSSESMTSISFSEFSNSFSDSDDENVLLSLFLVRTIRIGS